ncbi:type II toxin-antitoxin system RelE/ParE family toxin [Lactobacillus sp. ESL0680]|uniref:type II toxin-antitoxin system RelE family toxin n=1 Tax=Lactobacillus sp. ESL0680 TaxID=2983210 RepID=UPI0023F7B96C|nr:type II toxin-antitoxin system RelE/ParE family toxin [Lactobacillus sp. ESL0680]WEV39491.1 type II toxin-antitoxin system RelE/ParE family toxin [Lactobacillus sp. ESL0680]
MAKFKWEFDKAGLKKFRKLDLQVQKRIITWLDSHITGSENPRLWGKALEGNLHTLWRYRVGKYRVIADIHDDKFVVLVINADKRNDVYKK